MIEVQYIGTDRSGRCSLASISDADDEFFAKRGSFY